jgi:hypothetical protein
MHHPAWLPWLLQVLIEYRQGDVGQQRRKDATLRRAGRGVPLFAELGQQPGFAERLDQREHPLVLDPSADPVHQGRVVDRVETRLDIRVQHPLIPSGAVEVDLSDRVVCPPPGPKPVGDRLEVGLEDGFQHQLQRGLDNSISHRRDTEASELPGPARLRDLTFPHR